MRAKLVNDFYNYFLTNFTEIRNRSAWFLICYTNVFVNTPMPAGPLKQLRNGSRKIKA